MATDEALESLALRADIRLHAHGVEVLRASVSMPRFALSFHIERRIGEAAARQCLLKAFRALDHFHLSSRQYSAAWGFTGSLGSVCRLNAVTLAFCLQTHGYSIHSREQTSLREFPLTI
ncbi:hypothetical protein DNTS_002083 [Danionella cerebrum]|uniref:Uncharacterized protein n=1 Tax=Danionella cerebrum TaxID=2873325 RepID=A0A553MZ57_9TELE|nr:hypothetical protein DNTS_002083 [Danionella translucida]